MIMGRSRERKFRRRSRAVIRSSAPGERTLSASMLKKMSGNAGNSPERQIGARSYIELPGDFSLYAGVRYVDDLPNQSVPSYTAVDASVDWQPVGRPLRVSFTVHNLNDDRHLEFGNTFIERSAFVRLSWTL